MPKSNKPIDTSFQTALLSISLSRDLAQPLHAQLSARLKELILSGRASPGAQLPPSRVLSNELSVSRITVTTALEQLLSEGYIQGRRGSGVFVASDLPEHSLQPNPTGKKKPKLGPLPKPVNPVPFETSVPDMQSFPHHQWARLFDHVWREPESGLLAKQDPFGWAPLRFAIARHLNEWRGINCEPQQIVITSGLVEAIELIARSCLKPRDTVLVEEPGYAILRNTVTNAGLRCRPSPIDANGFDIQLANRRFSQARAVAITPSRHFPTGITMPVARRLELLDWARRKDALIIEDDFDSEYRYQGQPTPALMSLDTESRVIYVGSFSKVLFSSLRLSFVVFPRSKLASGQELLAQSGSKASLIAQPVLAKFIDDGAFAIHIRRMRRLYAQRQKVLVDALSKQMASTVSVQAESAGMHVIARLRPNGKHAITDTEAAARIAKVGVTARALSSYYAGKPTDHGLVLGFAAYDDASIIKAVRKMNQALKR